MTSLNFSVFAQNFIISKFENKDGKLIDCSNNVHNKIPTEQ